MKTEFKGETILRAFGLTALEVIKTALVGRGFRNRVAYLWVIRKKIERRRERREGKGEEERRGKRGRKRKEEKKRGGKCRGEGERGDLMLGDPFPSRPHSME